MESFPYETVPMPENLPVLVFERFHDSGKPGCEFHWHEELEFYYVECGGVLLNCGGEQRWLYPGDVGFVNGFLPHRGADFLDGTRHYIIQISLELFRQELHLSDRRSYDSLLLEALPRLPAFFTGEKQLSRLFASLIEEWRCRQPGWELEVKSYVLHIGSFLLRKAPLFPEAHPLTLPEQDSLRHVKDILLYLASWYNYPEKTSLSALSSAFGLSEPYLCRIFRRHTGRTVTGYINELRCARAAALIHSGISLTEAGRQVGIEDYNYFSRMFKKTTGYSPSHYRKI